MAYLRAYRHAFVRRGQFLNSSVPNSALHCYRSFEIPRDGFVEDKSLCSGRFINLGAQGILPIFKRNMLLEGDATLLLHAVLFICPARLAGEPGVGLLLPRVSYPGGINITHDSHLAGGGDSLVAEAAIKIQWSPIWSDIRPDRLPRLSSPSQYPRLPRAFPHHKRCPRELLPSRSCPELRT